MIHEYERYYGTVFTSLLAEVPRVRIQRCGSENSSYILNENLGIYVKHSTARVSPWSFSFRESDFQTIDAMFKSLDEIAFALACGFHGVCIISSMEFEKAAGTYQTSPLRITVRTMKGGSWKISGTVGVLKKTKSKTKPWEPFKSFLEG